MTAALSLDGLGPNVVPQPTRDGLKVIDILKLGGGVWRHCNQQLEQRPLLTNAIVMALGLAIGDMLAATIMGGPAFTTKTLQMAAFGLLFQGPALHCFSTALDANVLPDRPTSACAIATKTAIDQLLWSPICTSMFFIAMELFQGNISGIASTVTTHLAPTMLANYSIWPVAHLVNYGVVPQKHRVVFVTMVNILWAGVLSVISSGAM